MIWARIFLGGAGLLLLFLLLPPAQVPSPVEKHHVAMGTIVRIALYAGEDEADELFALAAEQIDAIDSSLSNYRAESAVGRLNSAGSLDDGGGVPELGFVVERCLHWSRRTGGAYDPTVGPLTALWNFPEAVAPPDSALVDSARALVDFRLVQVGPAGTALSAPGMRVDLGGSAKGYAVDRAVEALRDAGLEAGLVEAGGDIRYWGEKPDGSDWRLGLLHPRECERYLVAEKVGLPALATSGDYEQAFEFEGRRYHHLLDPATGYPAARAISASVWTETALDADILATAVFVMGPDEGIGFVETLPRAEAVVFFLEDGAVRHRASSGLDGRLKEMTVPRNPLE